MRFTRQTIFVIGPLVVLTTLVAGRRNFVDDPNAHRYEVNLPRGLGLALPVPPDNPLTPEKVALGRRLFFDPMLSDDHSTSCSSCHDPDRAFAGTDPVAIGIGERRGRRNAPSLLNRAFGTSQFWDGRTTTLEEQALKPIESADELGSSIETVLERLRADETYQLDFGAAFDDGITENNLAKAIASFQRTLISGDSPNDRFTSSQFAELPDAARKGRWIFESNGQCWRCHSGPSFTDEKFHNTGVSWGVEPLDLGRFEVTGIEADRGKFKTPMLRSVANSAPYMHDGSIATLREVVEFYRDGGVENPNLDEFMKPIELSEEEVDHLVSFLESLTGHVEGEAELVPVQESMND